MPVRKGSWRQLGCQHSSTRYHYLTPPPPPHPCFLLLRKVALLEQQRSPRALHLPGLRRGGARPLKQRQRENGHPIPDPSLLLSWPAPSSRFRWPKRPPPK